jgi:molecular chaperone DnaK (HSP70)
MSQTHSAIGVDIGSSRFVVAVAKKGGVEVIVNEASYRQTPCIVTYGQERRLGDRSLAHIKKELRNSIFYPTRLLGDISATVLQHEEAFNYSQIRIREDSRAQFHVKYEGEDIAITAEQAVGALFTEMIDVLELNNIDNREMVISVPSYFNQVQRQALIDAANIAGVEVIKLYNESSATVMNYGIFRKSDLSIDKPRTVAFVDVGHSKTSVYIANIWSDRADIVIEEANPNLGVRNIDLSLLFFYLQKFQQKHKVDLTDNPKALYRLIEAIERQRKVFTANAEAIISVECLFEDIDFSYTMKRDEFEKIANKSFAGIHELLTNCYNRYRKNSGGVLHSVERVGGGSRIPIIEHLITKAFNIKSVSKTLDASESVSRGCAIQSAIMSPLFKVAEYKIVDKIMYPIQIKLKYEGDSVKTKTLFECGAEFNKSFSVGLSKPLEFSLGLFIPMRIGENSERQITDAYIEKTIPISKNFETKVTFYLNKNGLVVLEKAELFEYSENGQKGSSKRKPKNSADGQHIMEENTDYATNDNIKITDIPFKMNTFYGLNQKQLQEMCHFEAAIIQKERIIKDTQSAKYLLESFIYTTRNKINDPANIRYTNDQEKKEIISALEKGEKWFYSDGQNADKETYGQNLLSLQNISQGFYYRSKAFEAIFNYYNEAMAAFREFETKNSDYLVYCSPPQLNDVSQSMGKAFEKLEEFNTLINNYSIQGIDQFDFETKKNLINGLYQKICSVVDDARRENPSHSGSNHNSETVNGGKLDIEQP